MPLAADGLVELSKHYVRGSCLDILSAAHQCAHSVPARLAHLVLEQRMKIVDPEAPDGEEQIRKRGEKQQRAQDAGHSVQLAKRAIFIYLGIGVLAPILLWVFVSGEPKASTGDGWSSLLARCGQAAAFLIPACGFALASFAALYFSLRARRLLLIGLSIAAVCGALYVLVGAFVITLAILTMG